MENIEPILIRVKEILKEKRLSETAFAKSIGMSQSTINNYMKGTNRPTLSFAEKILNAYPDISAEWLIRGSGDMYLYKQCDEGGGGNAPSVTCGNEDINSRLQKLQDELNEIRQAVC